MTHHQQILLLYYTKYDSHNIIIIVIIKSIAHVYESPLYNYHKLCMPDQLLVIDFSGINQLLISLP